MSVDGFGIGGFGFDEPFGSVEMAPSASSLPPGPGHEVDNIEPRPGGKITGNVFVIQMSSDKSNVSGVIQRTKVGVPSSVKATPNTVVPPADEPT